jgi:hypothetical protein
VCFETYSCSKRSKATIDLSNLFITHLQEVVSQQPNPPTQNPSEILGQDVVQRLQHLYQQELTLKRKLKKRKKKITLKDKGHFTTCSIII